MSAAVAGTIPRPEIPATKPKRRARPGPQTASQRPDPIPNPADSVCLLSASYTNSRDVIGMGGVDCFGRRRIARTGDRRRGGRSPSAGTTAAFLGADASDRPTSQAGGSGIGEDRDATPAWASRAFVRMARTAFAGRAGLETTCSQGLGGLRGHDLGGGSAYGDWYCGPPRSFPGAGGADPVQLLDGRVAPRAERRPAGLSVT